jgi:BlaI family transcriptional regulator, penicillinase repressor
MTRFTSGELAVMKLLWQHGEMKPADMQRRFPWEIKNPALRSHLTILLGKGHVTRRKHGKAFLYKAATRQQSAFQLTLRELIDNYCEGSVHSLLLNLIQTEKLTSAELLELERIAKGSDSAPRDSKRKQS